MSRNREGSTLGVLLASLLLEIPLIMLGGVVLMTLWNWFIPTLFHSAPEVDVAQAIGIDLVVSFMTHQRPPRDEDADAVAELGYSVFYRLVMMVLFITIGAVVHTFIV